MENSTARNKHQARNIEWHNQIAMKGTTNVANAGLTKSSISKWKACFENSNVTGGLEWEWSMTICLDWRKK
jgi:hypothetical protein